MKKTALLLILLAALAQPLGARPPAAPPPLTWEAAPSLPPIRHLGDWARMNGWPQSPPPPEQTYDIGQNRYFPPALYEFPDRGYVYTLAYRSERAYFWFPPALIPEPARLSAAGDYWETTVWPLLERDFGLPYPPGLDGDPRLHLVHEEQLGFGAAGLFPTDQQCPAQVCPNSNQLDLLYYSLNWGGVDSAQYRNTLIHEAQHYALFFADGNERTWLNEGFSQMAEYLAGAAPEDILGLNWRLFLRDPNLGLNTWAGPGQDPGRHYAAGFLFCLYLYERFGPDFFRALVAQDHDGLAAVAQTLQAYAPGLSLEAVVMDWAADNYQAGYPAFEMTPPPLQTGNHSLWPYAAHYWGLSGGDYRLNFAASPDGPLLPIAPAAGDWMWWGGNQEYSGPTLGLSFDLGGLSAASLQYQVWYQLEAGYDWAGLLISVDGGATWQALQSPGMAAAQAENLLPIPHYTGSSDGWLPQTIDLGPYLGQKINLRFQVVTDGNLTEAGLALDDIRLPELGLYDIGEGEGDWQSAGFMAIPARIPQTWALALIQGEQVQWLPPGPNLRDYPLAIGPEGAALMILRMAPFTPLADTYALSLESSP